MYILRGCGELNSKGKCLFEVLRFHPDSIGAIYSIVTALKVILVAQIQGVVNSKDSGVHQVPTDSVSAM